MATGRSSNPVAARSIVVSLPAPYGGWNARDSLVADVEAIAVNAVLPGVKQIVPAGYVPDLSNSGERPIVVGRQRFEVLYVTTQGDPSTTL